MCLVGFAVLLHCGTELSRHDKDVMVFLWNSSEVESGDVYAAEYHGCKASKRFSTQSAGGL